MSHLSHQHDHDYLDSDHKLRSNQRKTTWVVALTAIMMVIEVVAGYLTRSMALLADGWHMASHAGALGISLVAYRLAQSKNLNQRFSFGAGKVIPLGGYTSAVVLAFIAILMGYHSAELLVNPVSIQFKEAIFVASVGLAVNLLSAMILFDNHHHHHEGHTHDHNLKSAYIHVIADALTSVFAIVALTLGSLYGLNWLDPVMGLVGSAVILRWAYQLCRETMWELLDGHAKRFDKDKIRRHVEDTGSEVSDLHIWRIAPDAHACELVVYSEKLKGTEFYRNHLSDQFVFEHLIVEERSCVH
ncbi:MAG: cation transporter [Bdellovibrionaceae bacterium]|nr:cation transporter [Pseudobdellovibrionaceae bacterium]|tara:strand:+ start:1830 stop:2732 length:903 start_codon:yes stop_codon:yes gene_type:complete